ncbi:MAG: LysM peptidoglycan-binding domain-containing protein [Treponema sp.]|nr:LysM peptidoglycan-binding domain-containing protein [Treponema sp.]
MKNLKKSLIIAATLIISTPFFADSTYKVEKGDTLFSISRKYQITVAELRAANNLSEKDVLKAGQKLIIPDADIGTAAALSTSNTSSQPKTQEIKTVVYTVQKGDTLYRIARNNGLTVPELLAINNLDSSAVIKVGQKLNVKASSNPVASKPSVESETVIKVNETTPPDTRNYGSTVNADMNTKWPVSNPKITQIKGKVSGVQLSAKENESVICIHEGTVMYVGTYRGFGQVLFIQTKTGLIYAYTGMGSVKVKKGDYALSGSELGTAGIDSISGKPQITFMVFQNGQPIDPAKAPRN